MGYDYDSADGEREFRLNVWGGGQAYDHMLSLGMAADLWRTYKQEACDCVTEDDDGEFIECPHHLAWLSQDTGEGPIPGYKFAGSNDGWLATERELKATLAAAPPNVRDLPPEGWVEGARADTWGRWLDFLTYCSEHGGMRTW